MRGRLYIGNEQGSIDRDNGKISKFVRTADSGHDQMGNYGNFGSVIKFKSIKMKINGDKSDVKVSEYLSTV